MPNLTTHECYAYLMEHYHDSHDCGAIIMDLCNCFDSHYLTEFVEYLQSQDE